MASSYKPKGPTLSSPHVRLSLKVQEDGHAAVSIAHLMPLAAEVTPPHAAAALAHAVSKGLLQVCGAMGAAGKPANAPSSRECAAAPASHTPQLVRVALRVGADARVQVRLQAVTATGGFAARLRAAFLCAHF